MLTRRQIVAARLAGCFICVLGGFEILVEPLRALEARLIVVIAHLVGVDGMIDAGHGAVSVGGGDPTFVAVVTPACSAAAPLVVLAAFAGFILVSGPLRTRLVAWCYAAAVVLVANQARIVASAFIGAWSGRTGLILFHDFVGTFVALAATFVGLLVMVRTLLPAADNGPTQAAGLRYADRLLTTTAPRLVPGTDVAPSETTDPPTTGTP